MEPCKPSSIPAEEDYISSCKQSYKKSQGSTVARLIGPTSSTYGRAKAG